MNYKFINVLLLSYILWWYCSSVMGLFLVMKYINSNLYTYNFNLYNYSAILTPADSEYAIFCHGIPLKGRNRLSIGGWGRDQSF